MRCAINDLGQYKCSRKSAVFVQPPGSGRAASRDAVARTLAGGIMMYFSTRRSA